MSGLALLAGGWEPKFQGTTTITPGNPTAITDVKEVGDVASLLITVSYAPAVGSGTNPGQLLVQWFADPGRFQAGPIDVIAPLLSASGLASGENFQVLVPRRAAWVRVIVNAASLPIGESVAVTIGIFGSHLPVLGLQWHSDAQPGAAGLIAPGAGMGPRVTGDERDAFPGRADASFRTQRVPIIAETAQAFDQLVGPAYTPGSSSSFTVPAGKVLRIQSIRMVLAAGAAQDTSFLLRLTTALTGNLIRKVNARLGAAGTDEVDMTLPEGMEFAGGTVLQFSTSSSAAAGGIAIEIDGFTYDQV